MSAPDIEFVVVGNHREFHRVRSSNKTIRFRVWRRAERVEFDADFFSTKWELSPTARQQIGLRWDVERRQHPCKRGACGGGKSCVILAVDPTREEAWQTFLTNLLARPDSWRVWNGHDFGPQTPPAMLEAA